MTEHLLEALDRFEVLRREHDEARCTNCGEYVEYKGSICTDCDLPDDDYEDVDGLVRIVRTDYAVAA